MQKIFTQELRFKDENGEEYPEWENKFIKDIFIFENNRRKPITSSLRERGYTLTMVQLELLIT